MRVLMFGWEFPPHITGGLGTACFGITKGLSSIGDVEILFVVPKAHGDENHPRIKLIAAGDTELSNYPELISMIQKSGSYMEVESALVPYVDPERFAREAEEAREKFYSFPQVDPGGKLKFSGSYGAGLYAEISNYALTAEVIAREHDFDIIHAHDWLTYPAGIAAKRVSGKPLIAHVHATDFDRSGGNANPRVFEIERRGMEQADKVITVSNLTRDIVIQRYHIAADKVVTVHNAVEPARPVSLPCNGRKPGERIVTFLGRITLQKGPEYFVKAAALVLKKVKDVCFVMAGSGDMLQEMEALVTGLGLSPYFRFPGFLKGAEVQELFHRTDVYVMTSVSEPFGIVPLEAMQAGVPVIISRQSGVSEILSNAIKVDFWDVEAIADAIHAVLHYKSLSRVLSEQGKKEVAGMEWERSARHIYTVYRSVLVA